MSLLFTPTKIGGLVLANRIVIAPMCQYSADDGALTDWHIIHLGHLALSGAGLLIIEASAVTPEGRISPGDAGLWDDRTEAAMARVLASVRTHSNIPLAIQLAHAGRKASTPVPWLGSGQLAPGSATGWQTVAPSALPFADTDAPPLALLRRSTCARQASPSGAALSVPESEVIGACGHRLAKSSWWAVALTLCLI